MPKRRVSTQAVGREPYLEREPSFGAKLLFFLSGLVFFASILGGAYWVFYDLGQRLWPYLVDGGWLRYLGARTPLEGAIRCYFSNACNKALLPLVPPNYFLSLYPIAGALILAAFASRLVTTRAYTKAAGTAKWASEKDLEPLKRGRQSGYIGFINNEGKYTPSNPPKKLTPIPLPERIRNGHFVVLGGPGAGKTTAFFLPNLLKDAMDGNTAVVVDFKFPDPEGLGEALSYFHAHGRKVYVFTPFEPFSMTMPLLAGGETREGALDIAEMLVPKRAQPGPDEFYRDLDRALLTTLIYAMSNDPAMKPMSPGKLLRKILEGPEKVRSYIQGHPKYEVREWSRAFMDNLTNMARDKVVGLFMGLASRFILFDHPRLDAATSNGNPGEPGQIDLQKVFSEPSLLYIGIPQIHIQGGKGQVLLQLIKRLLDKAILAVSHKNGGKLPIHAAIYLDEFPNFGPLPNMVEVLATMRSRRVSYLISFQDHAQGYAVYGQEEFDAMFGTVQNIVVFPSRLTGEDRKWFSEILGNTAALERSYTEGGHVTPLGTFDRRAMEALRETKRELLTVDEMQTFPQEEVVVLTPGIPPIRAFMPYIFADGKDKSLMRHPWAPLRKKALRYNPMDVLTVAALEGGARELPQVEPGREEEVHHALFVAWLEGVLRLAPKVSRKNKNFVLSKLPPGENQAFLAEWERLGWLSKEAEGWRITREGENMLPNWIKEALAWMEQADPVLHWLRKHRQQVALPDKPTKEALAKLEATTLWVPEEVARQSLPPEVLDMGTFQEKDGVRWWTFALKVVPELVQT